MFLGFYVLKGIHHCFSAMVHTASRKPKILVICGPSGSGKSTLLRMLFSEYPDKFGFSVSHTTRKPRPGEEDGVHYHFTSKDKMIKSIEDGDFLEHATYSSNMYGTSLKAVEKVLGEGKVCVLDIDTQGVRQVKQREDLNAVFVFVKTNSISELKERLVQRGTETKEAIEKRISVAAKEMEYADEKGNIDLVIVNDNIQQAYSNFKKFIMDRFEIN